MIADVPAEKEEPEADKDVPEENAEPEAIADVPEEETQDTDVPV